MRDKVFLRLLSVLSGPATSWLTFSTLINLRPLDCSPHIEKSTGGSRRQKSIPIRFEEAALVEGISYQRGRAHNNRRGIIPYLVNLDAFEPDHGLGPTLLQEPAGVNRVEVPKHTRN